MAGSTPPWTTIESDPGVFTELIEQMGVSGLQVEELYSLDSVKQLRPVYGLIFLFKWQQEKDTRRTEPPDQGSVYFARQVITNACATQAIVGILFNSPTVSLGPELTAFRDFTADLPPDLKGESLGDSELIRQTHNSFAAPHSFLSEEARAAKEEDDVFHFISYIPAVGHLWELDGLKPGPIDLGPCPEEDWLDRVQPSIQARIERYASSEIRFNLMAVVADRRATLRSQLQELGKQREAAAQSQERPAEAGSAPSAESDSQLDDINATASQLEQDLAVEEEKRARWRDDNIARKHNYIPLMFTLLRLLAERGELQPLIDKAKAS